MPRTPVRATLVALVALSLTGLPVLSADPAATALVGGTGAAVVTLVSPTPGSTVGGGFTATFDVDLGAQDETTLTVGYDRALVTRTIASSECASACRVDVPLAPGGDFTQPSTGIGSDLGYSWTTAAGPVQARTYVYYELPALRHTVVRQTTATPNTSGYSSLVVDSTVTFVVNTERSTVQPQGGTPLPGETVEARLVPMSPVASPDYATVLDRRVLEWTSTPSGYTTSTTYDFSSYPEGTYYVVTRGRSAEGWYAPGPWPDGEVVVRHAPPMTLEENPEPELVGKGRTMNVTLRGPLAKQVGYVEVSRDGVVVNPGDATQWWPTSLTSSDVSATRLVGLGTAPVGHHTVSARMLVSTSLAVQVGSPATTSYDVVTLGIRVTPQVAFVGRQSTVTATADAPAGRVIESIDGELKDPTDYRTLGSWCVPCGGPHGTGSASFTPLAAGTAHYTVTADAGDWYWETATGSFPVYAYRRVSAISAPATRYGSTQKVTIRLTDDRGSGAVASPAGVGLNLQFRKTGTTSWVTVASAKTTTGGVAALAYTSRANGHLRVSYATPAPGVTWVTGATPVTSVAAAFVTSAPTTAYRSRTVTIKASTYPYQSGATVSLQTRVRGTTTWRTVKTIPAPSSGVSSFSTTFSARGTYELRIARSGTSLNAVGYSAPRTIAIS